MSYSDIITVRPEVLKGNLEGIIDIQNLLDGQAGAIETNAELFFEMTFPTSDIRLARKAQSTLYKTGEFRRTASAGRL